MKTGLKKTYFIVLTTIFSLFILSGCKGQKRAESSNKYLSLNTFSFDEIPSDMDGCSCIFSKDSADLKNGSFIYVNDYSKKAMLKINNQKIIFNQDEATTLNLNDYGEETNQKRKITAENPQYKVEINIIDGERKDMELWAKKGEIKIIDKKSGEKITEDFYGECGC